MAEKNTPRNLLRRRTLLALIGGAALTGGARAQRLAPTLSSTSSTPACTISPAQTEGPFFLDQRLHRADIRTDSIQGVVSTGVPLTLQVRALAADAGCAPLSGVIVEVWHCNATGVYSGVQDPRLGKTGTDFLRGYQVTDREGVVRFRTVYPGWYPGRAVHIHVMLRWPADGQQRMAREWSSQLYFDDAITDRVHTRSAYPSSNARRQRNADDGLFRRGGKDLLLAVAEADAGYVAHIDLGVRAG